MLLELELPRLLAPDLPSNCFSRNLVNSYHSNYKIIFRYCIVISCHYLSFLELGNLRACCLPQMWQLFLRLPLRNRTLIPRYPSQPCQVNTLTSKADRSDTRLIIHIFYVFLLCYNSIIFILFLYLTNTYLNDTYICIYQKVFSQVLATDFPQLSLY